MPQRSTGALRLPAVERLFADVCVAEAASAVLTSFDPAHDRDDLLRRVLPSFGMLGPRLIIAQTLIRNGPFFGVRSVSSKRDFVIKTLVPAEKRVMQQSF